jgi:hypothetical protein
MDANAGAVAVRSRPGPAVGDTAGPLRRNWLFALLLVAGWLVQAGLRAWFSRAQAMPLDNPDETAYLVAARVLGGGPAADFSGSTLYRGGYPLLITPVYWFTSSPAAVYHAVLLINAAISATVMPLGYLVCRRLGLVRPAAYGVAMVAALLPVGFFFSEYAISDAIFPAVTLAWLLATHSWLVAASPRARYAAAIGSAVLSGYAYAVHPRGTVLLGGFAAVGAFIAWRRPAARGSVAAAALTAVAASAAGWALDRYLAAALYPKGTRSLSGALVGTLGSVYGAIHVAEMAGGQLWRLVLDSWGIAGIGLVAAAAVALRGGLGGSSPLADTARRGVRTDLRVMASLLVGVTILIAVTTPAALPPHQTRTWASGRYLDGMTVTFFLIGAVVLLQAAARPILAFAAGVAGLTTVAAVTVAVYAGPSLPTKRGRTFNFGEPAVLTQNWSQASVLVATAAALGLLFLWVYLALLARYVRALACGLGAAVAAVSLVAVAQLTAHCSLADGVWAQAMGMRQMTAASALKPGDQVASDIIGILRFEQVFEISSAQVRYFNPYREPPPAGATVVEAAWPKRKPAEASWPKAPAGWRIAATNRFGNWVLWRRLRGDGGPPSCRPIRCSALARSLHGPQPSVGIPHGRLPGPVVGVLEGGDDLDGGAGAEPVRVGRLEHEPDPGLPVCGDFGDEHVRAVPVAELAGIMAGIELQLEAESLEELRRLAPVVSLQEHGLDSLGAHVRSLSQTTAAGCRECRGRRAAPRRPAPTATSPTRWHGA